MRVLLAFAVLGLSLSAFAQKGSVSFQQSSTAALNELRQEFPDVRVFRQGVRVSRLYGVPFAYGFTPEQTATDFVDRYQAIFEPGEGELVFQRTLPVMDGKFTAVYFQQFLLGRPVEGATLVALVSSDIGSPLVYVNSNVQPVSYTASLGQIASAQAVANVRRIEKGLALESTPVMVGWHGETETHLAWKFLVGNGTSAEPRRFTAFVDSSTGDVLQLRNEVYYTDINGHVDGMATPGLAPNQANNPPSLFNLVGLQARVNGGNTGTTNGSGNFTISHGGTTAVDVIAELRGQWVRVVNSAGANSVLTQNVTPPGPANFTFNSAPTEFVQSQVDGFIHTMAIHNFAKAINGSYPGIDIQIPCNVNQNSTCNAFYSSSTINFYRAGGGCPNTAYSTVVYHEYGHFIIDMGHPSPTGDYHEGIADVTASLAANTPCLGQDFQGQGQGCLRNAYNSVMHPCSGGSHLCGQVISGAFWLTKDQLDVTMGAGPALTHARMLYLNSILLHPNDINPGVTIDVLTLDDDDNDLNNGTPHYDEIATGFGAKNLDAPELLWLTITPNVVPGEFFQVVPDGSRVVPLSVTIANNAGVLDPTSPRLVFRRNGGAWMERNLARLTPVSPFFSYLSQEPVGTIVEWYIKAKDTNGHEVNWPVGEPNSVAFGNALVTTFNDTFETDLGWTVTNTSLTTGAWTRANPNGTTQNGQQCNPENDSTDAGSFCAFTGQGAVGGAVGTQDVDGGPTTITSPVFDLSGGNGIVDFAKWFYNDDGDDSLTVQISNNGGASWTTVSTTMYTGVENAWVPSKILVGNVIAPTNNMRVRVMTSDNPNNSITEAAIDAFRVRRIQ